jgi:competence protein ComEC
VALLAAYSIPAAALLVLRRLGAGRLAVGTAAATLAGLLLLPFLLPALRPAAAEPLPRRAGSFVARVLDVGQGDAILLWPPGSAPLLVDAGPPDAEVGRRLRALGVDRLAAFVLTHEQADHAGGVPSLLREVEVGRFLHARASASLRASMSAAGARATRIAAGDRLRFGDLRLEVLWPPRELAGVAEPSGDPNSRSLVLIARWRRFELLLTGDAEAELAPVNPGPVDVLKVAHHGSADTGLDELLRRIRPTAALISVGENSYGHPAPETLADLRSAGVPALRTDRVGDITIEVVRNRAVLAYN